MGAALGKSDKALPGQLGLLPGFEAQAAHFFETPYVAVERLLAWITRHGNHSWPYSGTWVDCCAGGGAIPRHVATFTGKYSTNIEPCGWELIEMRDERTRLETVPNVELIESPCRIQDADGSSDDEIIGITNLPWYAETIDVVDAFWHKYPNAWLIGLLCTQFAKDGIRPEWYDKHLPEYILRHGGRLSFTPDGAKYPHPVEWNIWRPGGLRGWGLFDVLTEEKCQRQLRRLA